MDFQRHLFHWGQERIERPASSLFTEQDRRSCVYKLHNPVFSIAPAEGTKLPAEGRCLSSKQLSMVPCCGGGGGSLLSQDLNKLQKTLNCFFWGGVVCLSLCPGFVKICSARHVLLLLSAKELHEIIQGPAPHQSPLPCTEDLKKISSLFPYFTPIFGEEPLFLLASLPHAGAKPPWM